MGCCKSAVLADKVPSSGQTVSFPALRCTVRHIRRPKWISKTLWLFCSLSGDSEQVFKDNFTDGVELQIIIFVQVKCKPFTITFNKVVTLVVVLLLQSTKPGFLHYPLTVFFTVQNCSLEWFCTILIIS